MLSVVKPEDITSIIERAFPPALPEETVSPAEALGRVLARDIRAEEYVPDFERSTVDGYALRAADSFGCSEVMPSLLALVGEVRMGEGAGALSAGECVYVPTGGAVPAGADAVQMLEYAEDFRDGTVGILRPAAPGENMAHRGEDVSPGALVLPAGKRLGAEDVGVLAALGAAEVPVRRRAAVGVISTGDELVEVGERPSPGQVRDVNSSMLAALLAEQGAIARSYGIVRDGGERLEGVLSLALRECDMVLVSGGSSVGVMDSTCRVIESLGAVVFHGVAMKPGKPTILGSCGGKPVVGLPGHPVAAFFAERLLVRGILDRLAGRSGRDRQVSAKLTEAVSANHGRAQYTGVRLREGADGLEAVPIRTKSGLISSLALADGCFCIPCDSEGAAAGETVSVTLYSTERED